MSAKTTATADLLRRYLSGAITAPEEAELERRAREDEVLADALRGLRHQPEEDHAARIAHMKQTVRERVAGAESKIIPLPRTSRRTYYLAAAALLLLVTAVFLLPRFGNLAENDLAMAPEPVTKAAPEPSVTTNSGAAAASDNLIQEDDDRQAAEAARSDTPPDPAPTASTQNPRPRPANASPTTVPPQSVPQSQSEFIAEATPEAELPEEEVKMETPLPPPTAAPTLPAPAIEEPEVIAGGLAEEAAAAHAEVDRREAARRERRSSLKRQMEAANRVRTADEGRLVIGRITDENGVAIPQALVRLPGLPLGQRTDTNGIFRLEVDAVASALEISHPEYAAEQVDISTVDEDLQITLETDDDATGTDWSEAWAVTHVPLAKVPGYALPEEGYNALRKRIEENQPDNVPPGKVKFSFLVDPDGTLSDFIFQGQPDQATMDYVGETIMLTSIWQVSKGNDPVRVHFKVVFD